MIFHEVTCQHPQQLLFQSCPKSQALSKTQWFGPGCWWCFPLSLDGPTHVFADLFHRRHADGQGASELEHGRFLSSLPEFRFGPAKLLEFGPRVGGKQKLLMPIHTSECLQNTARLSLLSDLLPCGGPPCSLSTSRKPTLWIEAWPRDPHLVHGSCERQLGRRKGHGYGPKLNHQGTTGFSPVSIYQNHLGTLF